MKWAAQGCLKKVASGRAHAGAVGGAMLPVGRGGGLLIYGAGGGVMVMPARPVTAGRRSVLWGWEARVPTITLSTVLYSA